MALSRRTLGLLLLGALVTGRLAVRLFAAGQDQAPTRREFTLTAKDFRYSPNRVEVARDDIVKLTVKSEDVAYSFTIDAYRVSKRVPAGGVVTFEFRADRDGTFAFYSSMTGDSRHAQMRGDLVVRNR